MCRCGGSIHNSIWCLDSVLDSLCVEYICVGYVLYCMCKEFVFCSVYVCESVLCLCMYVFRECRVSEAGLLVTGDWKLGEWMSSD